MKLASLFLVLPVLFWGLSFVAIKVVLRELDPVEMISMRFLIAAPILYAITRFKRLSIWPKGNWRLLGSGALIVFTHFWIMARGMQETSASNTAWILATAPIFIAILARFMLKEKLRLSQWLGLSVATMGVLLLTANGEWSNLSWLNSRGDLIILSSCVTWALYTIVARKVTSGQSPLVVTFWMIALAGIVFVPYSLISSGIDRFLAVSDITWYSLIFLGAFCLAFAFWMWAEGLRRFEAAHVGLYLYIEPIFAMIFAALLLGEQITVWLIAGAALITVGVFVAERVGRIRSVSNRTPADAARTN